MSAPARAWRLNSIDFLRGLVMVIMALDHVRDFFTELRIDPLDPDQTTAALYITRWITHFCAPIFVMLAGMSAGLMAARRSTADLSKFLFTRGLWLVFIEVTVVSAGWSFSFIDLQPFPILQVIWAIGVSMLVMSALVWLPRWAMLAFGLTLIFGHNILDYGLFPDQTWQHPVPWWHMIHNSGYTMAGPLPISFAYPLVPWIGLMPIGYCLASLYGAAPEERQQSLIRIGLGAIALFFLLRAFNIYGDPVPWTSQATLGQTVMAFFNVQKYPPSLLYLLATLGPGLIVLALAEKWHGRFVDWMVTFGRVPFFYYILHIYLIHALALVGAELQGHGWRSVATMFFNYPKDYGFGLGVVWGVWILTILILYPACKWFAGVKARRKDWWLSYL